MDRITEIINLLLTNNLTPEEVAMLVNEAHSIGYSEAMDKASALLDKSFDKF